MSAPGADELRRLDEETRRSIVTSTDRSMLVEASAGTGKTTLLVDRILHGIRSGTFRLPQVVAITFTEKAAAELGSRLRHRLALLAHAEPLPPEQRRRVETALEEIDRAVISTIHAFCALLLKEHALEAGIDPEFDVLDETRADLLKEESWRTWLAAETQRTDGPLVDALLAGVRIGTGRPSGSGLKDLADAIVTSPEALEPSLFTLSRPRRPLAELAGLLSERAREALPFVQREMNRGNNDSRRLREALENVARADPAEVATIRAAAAPLLHVDMENALRSFGKACREEGRRLFAGVADVAGEMLAHLACDLFEWMGGFAAHYREEKRRWSAVDFQDLLLITARMLRQNKEVRRRLQRRFRAFFVDEFQDTDPLQAEIIAFLCEATDGAPADLFQHVRLEEGKLFVVGDPKQSIYRFRRADVKVYEQFKALFERLAPQGGAVCRVFRNFRSSPALISHLNAVFEQVLRPPGQAGVYQAPHVPLVAAANGGGPSAAVIAVYPPPGTSRKGLKIDAARRLEAAHLALLLKDMVEGRLPPGFTAPDCRAPLGYGGVALLFRALTSIDAYEEALEQHGIPYRVLGGRSFYQREEIAETLSLLRAVDDPLDQVSIVAALRSSYFALSDEELLRYRESGGRWDYLLTEVRTGPGGEAMSLLARWHARRNEVPPHALLREILDHTKALEAFMLKPAGHQRVANVQKLLGQLRALWKAARGTFRSIIDYLALLDERGEAEEESSTVEPGDDFVRLMSIHKAKGLEFDAVVLPDLSHEFPRAQEALLLDRAGKRLALSVQRSVRSREYAELAAEEEGNRLAEQRRLLYVAATRARRLLVLPLYWQNDRRPVNCMLEFLLDSGCFPSPEEVPFGQQHNGVFYWDTARQEARAAPSAEPAPPVRTGPQASADALLARRREWLSEHDRIARRASTGWRILLPSAASAFEQPSDEGRETEDAPRGKRFGALFHSIMKVIPLRGMGSRDEVASLARGLAAIHAADAQADEEEAREAARLAAQACANATFRGLLANAMTIGQEVPFRVPVDRLPGFEGEQGLLEGSIDLVLIGPGRAVILDYKTEPVTAGHERALAVRYWPQLVLYGLAAQGCGYVPAGPELVLFFVRSGRFCRRQLDHALLAETRPHLEEWLSRGSLPGQ